MRWKSWRCAGWCFNSFSRRRIDLPGRFPERSVGETPRHARPPTASASSLASHAGRLTPLRGQPIPASGRRRVSMSLLRREPWRVDGNFVRILVASYPLVQRSTRSEMTASDSRMAVQVSQRCRGLVIDCAETSTVSALPLFRALDVRNCKQWKPFRTFVRIRGESVGKTLQGDVFKTSFRIILGASVYRACARMATICDAFAFACERSWKHEINLPDRLSMSWSNTKH